LSWQRANFVQGAGEQVTETEFVGPMREIGSVESLALNLQNAKHVAPLAV
jgi:hypothetical protein